MDESAHHREAENVLESLDADETGLTVEEARRRLETHGKNELGGDRGRGPLAILVAQFDSALIWVLVGAALLSIWAGHAVDAVLIVAIVVANGVFGFAQDYRAEESLAALRAMAAPTATVRRDGAAVEREATTLVPGDVIELEGGDVVPADCRLLATSSLEVDEAALTGESEPVAKDPAPVAEDAPLAERTAMVYRGTSVTRGSGVAVVVATGMATEVGAIAGELAGTEATETPLQADLDGLGYRIGLGVLGLTALILPLLVLGDTSAVQAGLTAISLAVAAVPEGLPAIVTLTLALGVRTMAEENALVRRLPAVEALGAVDVICTDKTGTLTEGRMAVRRVWLHDEALELADTEPDDDRLIRLLEAGALCNDATDEEGDPTERALVDAAADHGIDVADLREETPRTDEVPFSAERRWMATVHDDVAYMKGAPAVVLERSTRVLAPDGAQELSADDAARVRERVDAFGDDALRVLAIAFADDPEDLEDLVLVGLVGMLDPPRPEVADAIAATRRAGIDVKMITGDHARTAAAIGADLGLDGEVLEGTDLQALTEAELADRAPAVDVYARTEPAQKVRILEALQAAGHVVAMTGDGVNDAPALQRADVGVAMGVRGTDVAIQASDVVLLDDDYATIERAVERGRAIFDTIWKFVAYLLSANLAEVAIVFLASLGGYLVLPAVQLLWINLLTDGLPALALGADPAGEDVMDRPPRESDRGIVDRPMLGLIGGAGVVSTGVILALFWWVLDGAAEVTPYAMTMVFTGFVVLEFVKLYVVRWLRETPTLSNHWLGAAVAGSLALQFAVLYTPLAEYFDTVALGLGDWALLGAVLLVALPGYLLVGYWVRRLRKHQLAERGG